MATPVAAAAVFGAELARAEAYHDLLAGPGVDWGLIGPRETERLWERHVLNSVAVGAAVAASARVVDVGSGAGLPGVPLALARPDVTVVLLEPLLRRANFLGMVVEELGLGERVSVVRGRAEDHRERYDVATCRAVAPLPRLLGWTRHLFAPRGSLVALKGASAEQEVADAAADLRGAGLQGRVEVVRVHPDVEETRLVIVSGRGERRSR